jgi:hypothetical protein
MLDAPSGWQFGGGGNIYPMLTWTNRPDMAGGNAPRETSGRLG